MFFRPQINLKGILDRVTRHKLHFLTIVAVIAILVAFHESHQGRAFPDWDKPQNVATAPMAPAIEPDSDAEIASLKALYDSDNPNVDAKYKLSAKLSSDEIHQLILDMECLTDFAHAHDQLYTDYNRLYDLLTNDTVRDALYLRIKNREGFKNGDLSIRWQEFYSAGKLLPIAEFATLYIDARVKRLKYSILGATYTTGDVKFVATLSRYYASDIPNLTRWVKKAILLQRWLVDDNVLTADSVTPTSIDKYGDASELINSIRQRHIDHPSTGPQAMAQIDRLGNSGTLVAKLNSTERAEIVASLYHAATLLGVRLSVQDNSNQVTWEDISHEMNIEAYANDPTSTELQEQKTALTILEHARLSYLIRKGMFRTINDALRKALGGHSVDNADAILSAYQSVMNTHAAHDEKQATQIADGLRTIRIDDIKQSPLLVSDVQFIKNATAWLDHTMKGYALETTKMDALLDLLRNSQDPTLRRMVLRYKTYDGVIDPFGQSPMRLYPLPTDPGLLKDITTMPHIRMTDEGN